MKLKIMIFNTQSVFLWEARTIENKPVQGILQAMSKYGAIRQLKKSGYYFLNLKQIPNGILTAPIKLDQLVGLLNDLILLLTSGLSIKESFELLQVENKRPLHKYICFQILRSLEKGYSIRQAFASLPKLFPAFFISMIEMAEHSNQLLKGFQSALSFYQEKLNHQSEIKKLTRYPKIVLSVAAVLILIVIVFIIPMFQNIYRLFGDDLPFLTQALVFVSDFIHNNYPTVSMICCGVGLFFVVPFLKRVNPFLAVRNKVKKLMESKEDHYIYALSMKLQLENGQPLISATKNAAKSLSKGNGKHGLKIFEYLESGLGLTEAYSKSNWFPFIFARLLSTAESAGKVYLGFEQIAKYLEQKRQDRFLFWNKFIEPMLMISLGAFILMILLAIYLPIFDLGNRVG